MCEDVLWSMDKFTLGDITLLSLLCFQIAYYDFKQCSYSTTVLCSNYAFLENCVWTALLGYLIHSNVVTIQLEYIDL